MFDKSISFSEEKVKDFLIKLAISLGISLLICPLIWNISEEYDVLFGSLIICLVPAVFGWKVGGLNAIIYVAAGVAGAPVFAGHQGGLHYLIPDEILGYSESTGFLFGYVMAAFIVGYLAEKTHADKVLKVLWLYIIGHIVIIIMGIVHLNNIYSDFDLILYLKSLIPSFLVKAGFFIVVLQMIARRIDGTQNSSFTKSES